jgi:ferredoxin
MIPGEDGILFCWFSGTGNTGLVVESMAETFRRQGVDTRLFRMGRDTRVPADHGRTLGLAFPVAYFSTYPFVWQFVENLPDSDGGQAFMVDTLAGFSGGLVGPLGRVLRRKGYLTVGSREIRMPLNFGGRRLSPARKRTMVDSGRREAEKYALDLLQGEAGWGRVPVLSDLMMTVHLALLGLLFSRWNQRRFGMRVRRDLCTGCGLCADRCPVGNIAIGRPEEGESRGFPVFGQECEFCLHCTAVCPEGAIRFPLSRGRDYRPEDTGS